MSYARVALYGVSVADGLRGSGRCRGNITNRRKLGSRCAAQPCSGCHDTLDLDGAALWLSLYQPVTADDERRSPCSLSARTSPGEGRRCGICGVSAVSTR